MRASTAAGRKAPALLPATEARAIAAFWASPTPHPHFHCGPGITRHPSIMQTALSRTPAGLRAPALSRAAPRRLAASRIAAPVRAQADDKASSALEPEALTTAALAATALLLPLVLPESAEAVPALIKGRTFSLIHPGAWSQWLEGMTARLRQPGAHADAATPHANAAPSHPPTHPLLAALPSPPPAAIMMFLFGGSVWAGYLGFQWRHAR